MARNSAGKWVARAGATGGSRTYRGQTPVNWYAALVVIVLLGILSVVFANYEYRHPSTGTSTTHPTTSTTWYAGITFDVCGKTQTALASNESTAASSSGKGIFTTGSGVITVAPASDSEAGKKAVLGKFLSKYKGLKLTATALTLPGSKSSTTYKDGQSCPKGTPDAGKKGQVKVVSWSSAFNSKAKPTTVTGDPATLRFSDNQLITVGFVPAGTTLKKNVSVVEALLKASTATSSTTTTTAAATASTTTTSATTTTTTAPPSTTTAPPSTTTTTTTGSAKKK